MKSTLPFKPDPDRLDPHMEALCRKVRKFSVSTAEPTNLGPLEQVDGCLASKEFDVSDTNANATNEVTDDPSGTDLQGHSEKHQLRLQNDWIARSLTSIAPRYISDPQWIFLPLRICVKSILVHIKLQKLPF